jgi:acyl carrier protein
MGDTMNEQHFLRQVETIIAQFKDEPVTLTLDSNLLEDVGLDSIDVIDLVSSAGEYWHVDLEVEELYMLADPTRVRSLFDYLRSKLAASQHVEGHATEDESIPPSPEHSDRAKNR